MKPFDRLKAEIIDRGLCFGCGACAAVCPADAIEVGDLPRLVGECTECGICYRACPQTLRTEVPEDSVLAAFSVRAADGRVTGQDGGFVTAALISLLEVELIDCAVAVGSDAEWRPIAKIVRTPEDALSCSKSKYSRCPVFPVLAEACRSGHRLAFVGLPCQIRGLRFLQDRFPDGIFRRVKLTVGLFCSEAFRYEFFRDIVGLEFGIPLKNVKKFDVKGKRIICFTPDGVREIPAEMARQYRADACGLCRDFSARYADISVGSAGSRDGRSSVIIRSLAGMEAFEAVRSGLDVSDEVDIKKIEIMESKKHLRNLP